MLSEYSNPLRLSRREREKEEEVEMEDRIGK